MEFTVQYLGPTRAPSSDHLWAVLMGDKHIIYTGSYRDCEDWLDQYENSAASSLPARASRPAQRRWCLRAMMSSFLGDDVGQTTPLHAMLLAAGLGVVFAVAATISGDVASSFVTLHRATAAGNFNWQESTGLTCCRHSVCDGDDLDIACALAPADTAADEP
jgi:hypothetical protein